MLKPFPPAKPGRWVRRQPVSPVHFSPPSVLTEKRPSGVSRVVATTIFLLIYQKLHSACLALHCSLDVIGISLKAVIDLMRTILRVDTEMLFYGHAYGLLFVAIGGFTKVKASW